MSYVSILPQSVHLLSKNYRDRPESEAKSFHSIYTQSEQHVI